MGSSGQDSVWAGTFWGFLNIWLCAPGAQLGLVIVEQMWVQVRMDRLSLKQLEEMLIFLHRHFSLLTGGPQLTFLTQLVKVLIFRQRHFSLLWGPIGPLRCLHSYW